MKHFDFQQKHFRDSIMTQLIEQINIFGNKSFNLDMFIVLSKVIDIAEHKILISQSNNYGANNYNLYWFQRYLIKP